MLKRYLALIDQEGIVALQSEVDKLTVDHLKAKYVSLTLILEYSSPKDYLKANPDIIRQTLKLSIMAVTTGKFVFNFLDTFLRKALKEVGDENLSAWFGLWVNDFIEAVCS